MSGGGKEITRYSQEQARHFRSVDPLTFRCIRRRRGRRRSFGTSGRKPVKATKCEINWELFVLGSVGKSAGGRGGGGRSWLRGWQRRGGKKSL